jgi:DNA mismatch endonuclease (patch repair protein)
MVDQISKERRSWNMSRIQGKDTAPEKAVRSLLHRMGYRFRLHRKDLPGRPDIVLSAHQTAVFVHGCFWHRHEGCQYAYKPKSRQEFWQKKFAENVARDIRNLQALKDSGWNVLIVWECELKDKDKVRERLQVALEQKN